MPEDLVAAQSPLCNGSGGMNAETTLETRLAAVLGYHQTSKHQPDRYAPGPHGLDWANQPEPFRTYAGAPRIDLNLAADTLQIPFGAVRSGLRTEPQPFNRQTVGILLELSLGLSAWKAQGSSRWALRCNPSSGNLHPTEGYVVCADLPELAAGVYHYVSRDHALERRAGLNESALPDSGLLLGLTSIHWREAWKYGLRAYRYCQHDVGHAIAAVAYAAAALGWRVRLLDGISDAAIAALLGLDREADFAEAEAEAPDVLLWVGADGPPDPLALPTPLQFQGRANRLSSEQVHWAGIEAVAEAAEQPTIAPEPGFIPPPLPPLTATATSLTAAALYRQRRSAVSFDGVTALTATAWFALLDALLPRANVPPLDALPWRPRVAPVFFVHRVEDVAPGLYVLARNPDLLLILQQKLRPDWAWQRVPGCPEHIPLYQLAPADCRDTAQFIACHQEIARDSAFAVGFIAEFESILKQRPWCYRQLFWETGLLGQILYLEAEAAGVRGTGIGCFFDDVMHQVLGIADLSLQSLYHFTVGGPVEDRRLQTLPPYAHLHRGHHLALPRGIAHVHFPLDLT